MKNNGIRIRISENNSGELIFKSLIDHPMETGLRRDKYTGKNIPADYIEDIRISVDGEIYFDAVFSENVSRNPYLSFAFAKSLFDGQLLEISLVDNFRKEITHKFFLKKKGKGSFSFSVDKEGTGIKSITPEVKPICKDKST